MDHNSVPIGFGYVLNQNTAAMNRYAQLTDFEKQDVIQKAQDVRSEMEMYQLVATLANGTYHI